MNRQNKKKLFFLVLTIFIVITISSVILFASENPHSGEQGTILETSFEDSSTSGWYAKGSCVVSITDKQANDGSSSLKVTGRTQTWEGPEYSLTGSLIKGEEYNVSVWVYQDSGDIKPLKLTAYNSNDSKDNLYDGSFYTTVASNTAIPSGEWTELSGSFIYDFEGNPLESAIYLESDDLDFDFYVDSALLTGAIAVPPSIQEDIPNLFEQYQEYFPIGVAVPSSSLENELQSSLIKKHFNSITAENDMKPSYMQPTEGEFFYDTADNYVNFAKQNNMRLRGHTLIWHRQLPDWFFVDEEGNDVSREVLLGRMEYHIKTLITKYGDSVESWDVVNEAIDEYSDDGMRDSKFSEIIGNDYVEMAFTYAKEAVEENNLNVRLFYNDYNYPSESQDRTQAIYDLVSDLVDKGLVDGVGYQGHIGLYTPAAYFDQSMEKLSQLGIDIEITELDMRVNDSLLSSITKETLIRQAYKYQEIMEVIKSYSTQVTGVTFWGLKDDMSWLNYIDGGRIEAPLLFDKNYQAKYAYWALVDPEQLPVEIQNANVLKGSARIDAKDKDVIWKLSIPSEIADKEGNIIGNFMTSWENGKLNAMIKIAKEYKYESIDIFVDEDNSKDETIGKTDKKYSVTFDNKTDSEGLVSKKKKSKEYYQVEVSLPVSAVTLEKGSLIGFDIRINIGENQISWNDITNSQDIDTSKYGILTLKDPNMINASKGKPVIDGKIDDCWLDSKPVTTNVITQGTDTAKAEIQTLWSNGFLYILANVTDDVLSDVNANPWEQDSVEVFLDENMARTLSYENDDGQYRVNYNNVYSGTEVSEEFSSATSITDTGYIVEMALPFKTINGKIYDYIGFDIQINDDNGSGIRTGMANWNDASTIGYMNTSEFGILQFVK
ncbi:MAG: endo-1,4-beta-xylanase [Clostridiales bacterium]